MVDKMNALATVVTKKLKDLGATGYPIKSVTSRLVDGRYRGTISLKHAAVLAGLGKMGKNTLLVNDQLGNMLWLSAVITSIPLQADPIANYDGCYSGCNLCVDACPVKALDDEFMKQRKCYNYAFKSIGGHLQILCWRCRKVCPNHCGIRNALK